MACTLLRRVQRASSVNSAAQSTNCGARFRKKDQWIATSPHSFDCIQACYTNQTVANSVYMKLSIASEVLWPLNSVLHKAATWSLKHLGLRQVQWDLRSTRVVNRWARASCQVYYVPCVISRLLMTRSTWTGPKTHMLGALCAVATPLQGKKQSAQPSVPKWTAHGIATDKDEYCHQY